MNSHLDEGRINNQPTKLVKDNVTIINNILNRFDKTLYKRKTKGNILENTENKL